MEHIVCREEGMTETLGNIKERKASGAGGIYNRRHQIECKTTGGAPP
jgi:hypothetical protein